MIATAGQNADALLEKRRRSRSQVAQQIRSGIPEGQQGFRGNGLAQAHHGFAIRKGKDLNGSVETICSSAVPIQTVAPSAERSALVAPGTEICPTRVWSEVEKTSTRFMARFAINTCLFAGSKATWRWCGSPKGSSAAEVESVLT